MNTTPAQRAAAIPVGTFVMANPLIAGKWAEEEQVAIVIGHHPSNYRPLILWFFRMHGLELGTGIQSHDPDTVQVGPSGWDRFPTEYLQSLEQECRTLPGPAHAFGAHIRAERVRRLRAQAAALEEEAAALEAEGWPPPSR